MPVEVVIPVLGVEAQVKPVDTDPRTNKLQSPSDFDTVGWYRGGPRPGERGAAVLVGHLDSLDGPAVFAELSELRPRDDIFLVDSRGKTRRFSVIGAAQHRKADFPTNEVYSQDNRPVLRLITCAGTFDRSTGHYTDNLIIYAAPRRG
jgi:sortase (surface protein transpeptidase)